MFRFSALYLDNEEQRVTPKYVVMVFNVWFLKKNTSIIVASNELSKSFQEISADLMDRRTESGWHTGFRATCSCTIADHCVWEVLISSDHSTFPFPGGDVGKHFLNHRLIACDYS